MAQIVIDARESGTSTGRYCDKLIEHLHDLRPAHDITILGKTPRLDFFKQIAPNFKTMPADVKEFTFAEQLKLLRIIKGLKPDLVHFSATHQPVLYRRSKVTTVHDLTTARFRNPTKNPLIFGVKQLIYRWLIQRVAKASRRLITPSQYVKKDLAIYAKIDPAKIIVTYEAADKISAPAEPIKQLAGQPFIFYVGRALPHKNLQRLVQAFEVLSRSQPQLKLVLAGRLDGNYRLVQAEVERRGLKSKVLFSDFVSEGQLRWLYENCRAYVFASLSEGFGLPSVEAMLHGAPVVCSNATCLPEVNGSAAVYFDPLDTSDMADKIARVLSDEKLRQKLIAAGAQQAAQYSWRTTAQQTLQIYNQILNK